MDSGMIRCGCVVFGKRGRTRPRLPKTARVGDLDRAVFCFSFFCRRPLCRRLLCRRLLCRRLLCRRLLCRWPFQKKDGYSPRIFLGAGGIQRWPVGKGVLRREERDQVGVGGASPRRAMALAGQRWCAFTRKAKGEPGRPGWRQCRWRCLCSWSSLWRVRRRAWGLGCCRSLARWVWVRATTRWRPPGA